ncbi:hypothetical protein AXF42_Ash015706 [Apostasia shenzhenica]|uniref:Uncharacterized protein n=1 Tax=Apostasia shenzhenica TaxID=1088818 RepID=A0A2H9ZU39_9ASPA|nr:hypothetical protein AXF42_Ash015706 [Apostasia shenzhenica]
MHRIGRFLFTGSISRNPLGRSSPSPFPFLPKFLPSTSNPSSPLFRGPCFIYSSPSWNPRGRRGFCSGYPVDCGNEVDEINLKFAEAREEIEAAMESKETVYFDEEAECAREAVKSAIDMFDGLLARLPERESILFMATAFDRWRCAGARPRNRYHGATCHGLIGCGPVWDDQLIADDGGGHVAGKAGDGLIAAANFSAANFSAACSLQ